MAAVTYTIQRGDSLWKICSSSEWGPKISGSNTQAKINTVVSLNNLANANLIYPGQVLTLSGTGGSSGSSGPSAVTSSNCVDIKALGLQADSSSGRDVFASWAWTKEHTKGFKIRWEYDNTETGETQFTESETSTPGERYSTFTVPDEVRKHNNWVQVFITPVSETYKVKDAAGNETEKPYLEDLKEVGKQYFFKDNPPFVPDTPTCEINGATLTIKIDEIKKEIDAASIIFQVVKDNKTVFYTSPALPVVSVTDDYGTVSHEYTVPLGSSYKVRAKSVASNGKQSGWTEFSDEVATKPSAPTGVNAYRKDTQTSSDGQTKTHLVYVEWAAVPNAKEYTVEYTTNPNYFGTHGGDVTSVSSEKTSVTISGIEPGETYYFRVIASNDSEDGKSDPSSYVELTVGTPPDAPTTWSSANSAFAGDTLELNWIHNSTDGSLQAHAEVGLKIGDSEYVSHVYVNNTRPDSGEQIDVDDNWMYGQCVSYKGDMYFKMDTTNEFLQNKKIQWYVRTAGVFDSLGEKSIERTVYVYEKATMEMTMSKDPLGETGLIETLDSFPFYVVCDTDQKTEIQKPVGYHVRIVSNSYYVTVDEDGTSKTINAGDAVYEKYISTNGSLSEEISANDVVHKPGISYTLYCTVDLNTGLTLTGYNDFKVSWTDVTYNIVADISFDKNTYTAAINPYCAKTTHDYKVEYELSVDADKFITCMSGFGIEFEKGVTDRFSIMMEDATSFSVRLYHGDRLLDSAYYDNAPIEEGYYEETSSGKWGIETLDGMLSDENDRAYIEVTYNGSTMALIDNITLSVYRREYDGTYTKIASDIPNTNTSVTDPHPALDYARYRIVAKDTETGAISYYDAPGYHVNCSSIIIQWNEPQSVFETSDEYSVEGPSWSGSLLVLPYNVDVSDSRNRSASAVEYAGREHPVSYYGTYINESASWNAVIPKEDKDTIYALRRLSIWAGDVYIREPSGMGYWANVRVSFNQKHKDVTVPVTLNITRVEGGV